ncbi:hypothetical protein KBY70_14265 [Cyanobium sp. ATX 6E8]|uniref:hypothetical protein n=1 Tax=Cyanobium sp. ATX 6E8 TaxID=2823701 RepID=UPI0020CCC1EB|nr:hypothetical protein [Cyanobium sp. ATX 6E8]MCP9943540.1 hypothetical protein [Cyanobium sp. ATX 6E8]
MFDYLDYSSYSKLAADHGPSFFVFDPRKLLDNYDNLCNAFLANYPKVQIGYSYKTNYTPQICMALQDKGAWAEVVSEMEYSAARRLGTPIDRIIFNGPYKADWAFNDAALGGAIINLDSKRDLDLLHTASSNALGSIDIKVVLRTNFPIDDSTSRFGFDVESDEFLEIVDFIQNLPNVHLSGLHCHFPNRSLTSFRCRAENLVALCSRIFPDKPPDILNIGGGFFSNLPESISSSMSELPASFTDYGALIGKIFYQAFLKYSFFPTLFLEPGTALVADVMHFYTKIVSTKSIRGRYFATVAGSIYDVSPNAKIRNLPVTPILDPDISRGSALDYSVTGFTCIEGDILTDSLKSPLEVGDALVYGNVGSYSVVMRPPFILPSNPVLMKRLDGSGYDLIKARQTNEDVFNLYQN